MNAIEDHCVTLCGYGSLSWLAEQLGVEVPDGVDGRKPGYAMFTWSTIGIVDVPSMVAVTQEAWLRQPTTVTKPAPASRPGLWTRPSNWPATGASPRWGQPSACSTTTGRPSGCTRGAGTYPDGRGACQGQRPLSVGARVTMDHDLIMWLTKDLAR